MQPNRTVHDPVLGSSSQHAGGDARIAFLFMLRYRLDHIDTWKAWLDPEVVREKQRVSLYFHLADLSPIENTSEVLALRELPGFRLILPTVATGWCELMAAEVALFKAALEDDPAAEMFVLLSHDAVPLVPFEVVFTRLMTPHQEVGLLQSHICPAGVRTLEMPKDCEYAIEPGWQRHMLLKHHQWLALTREHASAVSNLEVLKAAVTLFQDSFLGEPLCSDEVLPLLGIAVYHKQSQAVTRAESLDGEDLRDIPLYRYAFSGIASFETGLKELGVQALCITYTPWPGCRSGFSQELGKKSKSPIARANMSAEAKVQMLCELITEGVLFSRKLGIAGDTTEDHMKLISNGPLVSQSVRNATQTVLAPSRLFPAPYEHVTVYVIGQALWCFACLECILPVWAHILLSAVFSIVLDYLSKYGGLITAKKLHMLSGVCIGVHLAIFAFSISASDEFSPLEPFRNSWLSRPEL